MLLLVVAVVFVQIAGEQPTQGSAETLKSVLGRIAKQSDLNEAGLILSSFLSDESIVRSAYLTSEILDERTVYILYGGHWGSRADVDWKRRVSRRRVLIESVSSKPTLIRSIIRADRYETYLRARRGSGATTLNSFPFFDSAKYADDMLEFFIEALRDEVTHPAEAVMSPFGKTILVSAEEEEIKLLRVWQMLCGICGRLDLLDQAKTNNWRGRFSELDEWFSKNRPYILWDDSQSCIRIDEEAKQLRRPTTRLMRAIPELEPPWLLPSPLKTLPTRHREK